MTGLDSPQLLAVLKARSVHSLAVLCVCAVSSVLLCMCVCVCVCPLQEW